MLLLALGWAVQPATPWKQVPIVPSPEATLFAVTSQEAVACSVELDLNITGELEFLSPLVCPDSLFGPVRSSVSQWRFNPATEGERAVPTRQKFTAVFEANTVWLPPVENPRYALIRVPPFAMPQWPRSPQDDEDLRSLFESLSLPGGSCVLELGLSERGSPEDLVIVDCPNEVALVVEKALKRWGMRTVGAELGDRTRYRLEMPF